MRRILFVLATGTVALLATASGYDGLLADVLERVPPFVSVLIQAILAISVLIAVLDGEWRRWFRD